MADYVQAEPEIPPPSGVDVRDWEGVTQPARMWQPGDEEPVMPPGGAPVRDWEGVTQPAAQWKPDSAPSAEPPGAINIATEWTTPRAGTTHFLVNGRVIRNEWQPAGARLGIGVSYPLEPPPPPPPPPPPGPVEVESVTLAPTSVLPGETATLWVRLKAVRPERSGFALSSTPPLEHPPTLEVAAGMSTASVPVRAPLGSAGSARITVSHGDWSQDVTLLIRTPPQPKPDLHNVRDYGAKGDGTTRDDQWVQKAILAAQPGHTVYFPPGRWNLLDSVKVYKNGGIRFEGDGEASVILHGNRTGLQLGTGGQPYEGLVVRGLAFEGLPGRYMKDGNTGQAIQIYGPRGTIVHDCWFRGSGAAVFNAGTIGTTYGTIMQRLKVNGWGVIGFFLNGGELVEDCDLIQDDPSERLERSSHGIYIHSGCDNVTVRRVLIERARKYGMQLYGQDPGTTIADVRIEDVTLRSCANGLTLQQSAPDRARVKNLLVERLICEDIYGGPALSIKQGDGVTFKDCRLACRAGVQDLTALQLGVWAPYQPDFWMSDMAFERLTLENAFRGVWALQSFGGRFERIRVLSPTFVDCRKEIDFEDWTAADGSKVPVTGVEIVR